jgi:hypothetical protein
MNYISFTEILLLLPVPVSLAHITWKYRCMEGNQCALSEFSYPLTTPGVASIRKTLPVEGFNKTTFDGRQY